MIPLGFRARNCCQHTEQEYLYELGITGILGRNGAGKTNFIDVTQFFSITGKTPKNVKKEELLKWGCVEGWTDFWFQPDKVNTTRYTLTRALHNSSATLSWTDADGTKQSVRGAEKIEALMVEFLGMDFDLFRETRFCGQDELVAIFRQTPAERLGYFQKIAGVKQAEILRTILQKQVNSLPVYPDRSEQIQNLEQQLSANQAELLRVQAALAAGTDPATFQARYREALLISAATSSEQVQQQIQQLTGYKAQLEAKLVQDLAAIPAAPDRVAPVTQESIQAYRNWQLRQQWTQALAAEPQKLVPEPAKPEPPDASNYEKATALLQEFAPKHRLMQTGVCPTCGHASDAGEREEFLTWYRELTAMHGELKRVYTEQKQVYDMQQARWQQVCAGNAHVQQSIANMQAQLAQLPEVTGFDEAAHLQQVEASQLWASRQQAYEDALRRIEEPRRRTEIASLQQQVDKLSATSPVSQAEIDAARQRCLAMEEQTRQWQALLQSKGACETTQRLLQQQLADYNKDVSKAQHVALVRQRLERCRDVLHREQLPSVVMRRFMDGINAYIMEYLGHFATDFSAYIDENFELLAEFRGVVVSANRLSGGQKVALAIAFRFAMADMMSRSAPIMVMDEPTTWLDADNVDRVADVLRVVRRVVEKGVYMMIATHEPRILSAMNRQFEVGASCL